MFPSAFSYVAPNTLDETYELLEQYGDDAKVLAGGQSLLPMMKLRLAAPGMLVDIGQVPHLATQHESPDALRIGALTRHAILDSKQFDRYPLLSQTAPWIADPLVRNRGTMGGSLAHADPAADWGATLLALKASVQLASHERQRLVALHDFFVDVYTTALEPQELLTEIIVPAPLADSLVFGHYFKLERKVGDFAVVGVAVTASLTDDGTVSEVGIGLAAMGSIPLAAKKAAALLIGHRLTPELIKEVAQVAAQEGDPQSDRRGSEEYKRSMVRVYVQRGLAQIHQEWQVANQSIA